MDKHNPHKEEKLILVLAYRCSEYIYIQHKKETYHFVFSFTNKS